jgi:hypothetical protein
MRLDTNSSSDQKSTENMAEDLDIESLLEEAYKKKDTEVSFFFVVENNFNIVLLLLFEKNEL